MTLFIGTAGWSIPRSEAQAFESEGPALARYASLFRGVEVNSSFHRPHRPSTWARWASLVPNDFRFAVKIPKAITHERRLVDCREQLAKFVDEVGLLGPKLAILLVQLPPKLSFDPAIAEDFFGTLTSLANAKLVCEPRHPSWFAEAPDRMLDHAGVARAAADPAPVPSASRPGGWRGLNYWRLHGSPIIYRSAYGEERLAEYASILRTDRGPGSVAWCMFDNTASSAATRDALSLQEMLHA